MKYFKFVNRPLLTTISLIVCVHIISCTSDETKVAVEASQILDQYNRCYQAEDYQCFREILDSSTLARLDELFTIALSEDDEKLTTYIANNQNKHINTYYAYLTRYGAKQADLQTKTSQVLSFLINNKYFGNDFTNAKFDKIDHYEKSSIWGFVVDSTHHETKILSRILYKKEGDKLKFSLIYRNSLINKRLFQANYSTEDIKAIIHDYFEANRGEMEIRNFTELVKVVNTSANF